MEVFRRQGIIQDELYFSDFKEYCSNHPEIRNLPENIKQYRYDLLEDFRKKTINQIREERYALINNNEEAKKRSENKEEEKNKNKNNDKKQALT